MKNLVKTFAIAALSAVSLISNGADNNTAPTKSKTFEVGMYQSVNTLKMNVMIEKSTDKNLSVVLKDEKGNVLYNERIAKNSKTYHGKYDLSDLADGKYTFEFTKGDEKVVKEVNLSSDVPTESNRQIVVE
ncbi:MAG: hypothetical protein RLZZ306_239 [Bacteroidota bacterium]|jgi:hypothetical protein